MRERRDSDEKVLIDFLLGRCDHAQAEAVRQRLEEDEDFRNLHRDLANTFAALKLAPQFEPPENIVDETLTRVRQQRATEALLAKEKPAGRFLAPTFSLRELGAVAAVVLILAAIFIPSIYKAHRLSRIGLCGAHEGEIGAAVQAYGYANDGYPPGVVSDSRRRHWLRRDGQSAVSSSAALFKLIAENYAPPASFQCPAAGGRSFAVRAGMSDFPAADSNSFSYQHTIGPDWPKLNDPKLRQVMEHMAILADSTPLFYKGRFRPDRLDAAAGDNHGGDGHNVLYRDIHVEYKKNAAVGVNGDNIFLAGDIRQYFGTEAPASLDDTFLLPPYSHWGFSSR
ncbi:MAG: type II secretion system protein [Planctomycetota bacterium]|jgi:hypothetical protein